MSKQYLNDKRTQLGQTAATGEKAVKLYNEISAAKKQGHVKRRRRKQKYVELPEESDHCEDHKYSFRGDLLTKEVEDEINMAIMHIKLTI